MNLLIVGQTSTNTVGLAQDLRAQGHQVKQVERGIHALAESRDSDLMLLDLDLPDMDGVALCRTVRRLSDLPIISFAARDDELSRVLGLEAGADDCISVPWRIPEVTARIDSVMRRVNPSALSRTPSVTAGPLRIEAATREVWLDQRRIDLTRKEFDLLLHLAQRPGSVVSRRRLMIEIWKHPRSEPVSPVASRTIDTHVSSLRSKLGDKQWVTAIRGVGFRIGQAQAARS